MTETETHFYGCQCNDCCSNHFQKQVEDNKSINLCHTDVNNPCYKNHQLVMEKIGFVERALDNYREYRTDIKDLCTDVMYLKEHKNRQIDENRKVSARVDKLENNINHVYELVDIEKLKDLIFHGAETHLSFFKLQSKINKIDEYLREIKFLYSNPLQQQVWQENIIKRLEKLEKWKEVAIDKNIQDLNRIKELEKSILNWEEEFYFIQGKIRSHDKKPHKCPVCNGLGNRTLCKSDDYYAYEPFNEDCISCEGTGVLWG